MIDAEKTIRKEAKEFYELYIARSDNDQAVEDFRAVKKRLSDFYSPESKAIFLDEIQNIVSSELHEHRNLKHDGKACPSCGYEIKAEKLFFYINQEISTLPIVAHQKHKTNSNNIRNKVFVSYSHLDKEHLEDIQRHFKPFRNQIDFWDDTKIKPGEKWKEEITDAINQTKVAILLVSTDFLGSDFIQTNEIPLLLKAAEEDGAVILIVILKPCLFEEFSELNQYQAMNPPSKTILKMTYEEKEELYVNLVRQTKKILPMSN